MMTMRNSFLAAVCLLAGCLEPVESTDADEEAGADASSFIERAEAELKAAYLERDKLDWVNQTHITDDTDWLAARGNERVMELTTKLISEAARYDEDQPDPVGRKLKLLKVSPTLPAPDDDAQRRELADIATQLSSTYGKG